MKVKVNRIKGNNLASLVKKMITMDSQIYLTLSDNQVSSSVFLATKDVVKKTYLGLADVFELDEPLDKPLKLAFFNGSKVISALQYFDLAAIHGEISCLESDGEYYAEYLTIEDNSLKMKLNCTDPDLGFISMTPAQIDIAFSNKAKKYEFDMVESDLTKIMNLNGTEKSELFSVYGDSYGIHIAGDNYDYIIDDSNTTPLEKVHIHKKFLDKLDKENYGVEVCTGEQNKLVLTSRSTETSIALNLALGVE
jgi:hypothetical protein